MLSIGFIKQFALNHANSFYVLISIGVLLEGEIMVILAGIFSHLESINIVTAFLATLLGCAMKSIIGYNIGYYLNKKHSSNRFLSKAEERIHHFLPNFSKKPFLSIFLSRFLILGIYWFSLIYAGYKKINIKTFIRAEISSFIVWSITMLSLGFFFSYAALSISRDIRNFLAFLLLFFIGFFLLEKIVAFVIELFEIKSDKNN